MDRRLCQVALAIYAVFLAVVLLSPSSGAQSTSVSWFADVLRAFGTPDSMVTAGRAEFVANALILMPVSALGSLVLPTTGWRDWTAWAFVIASGVELAQGLLLPARSATMIDIVANTLGGLLGAAVVLALRRCGGLDELDHR